MAMMSLFGLVIVLIICQIEGFVYQIDEKLKRDRSSMQISEGYMYASHHGPFLFPKGSSEIDIRLDITSSWSKNASLRLDLVVFGADETDKGKAIAGICSSNAMS